MMAAGRFRRNLAAIVLALVLGACTTSGSTPDDSDAGLPDNVNRSPTCIEFQRMLCDYSSGRCGRLARAQCDELAGALYCADDEATRACIDTLRLAGCTPQVEACEGIIDPKPAIYICNRLLSKICGLRAGCGFESRETCLASSEVVLPCDEALGIGSGIDACMLGLDQTSCGQLEIGALPQACSGVVSFAAPEL